MLSLKEFTKHIETIKNLYELDDKISDLFNVEGIVCCSSDTIDSITKLLEEIMGDQECNWISYWLWELNFGEDDNNSVSIGEVHIPLTTIEDLYNMILRDKKDD